MAEHAPARVEAPSAPGTWSAERIAHALVPRRDRLVDRLPRELAAARGLTRDQRELVIDEAIDYLVTEYSKPITAAFELERALWATAAFRVKRVHEGRGATVRAGWNRVDLDDVELSTLEDDPEAAAVERVERLTLLEFAATLTPEERDVLARKYGGGEKINGRFLVARQLGLPVSRVRKAEREIQRKLERFIAVMTAGSLCAHRAPLITALAGGEELNGEERLARLHLEHCPVCRTSYKQQVRELRSGDLPRKLAELLPVPPVVETARHPRTVLETVADWCSRPFAHDVAATGTQLSAGTRGLGAVAAAKLATVCLGGATVVGGGAYCLTTGVPFAPSPEKPKAQHAAKPAREPRATPIREETVVVRAPRVTPTPTPTPRPTPRARTERKEPKRPQRKPTVKAAAPTITPQSPTQHEREVPISPPATTASNSASEFDPQPASAPVAPAQPAAAPASGGPEFP